MRILQREFEFYRGECMSTNVSNERIKSLILELSDRDDLTLIGSYCDDFSICYANNKMAHMLGYTNVDDLIHGIHGKLSNGIHPEDMDRVMKELNHGNYYEGMTYKITYRMLKKDGTFIWIVNQGKVIQTKDGRLAVIGICEDMTAFLNCYAEFEGADQFSKFNIENIPGAYYRCAAEKGYPFLYISDHFCEIFDWTREEIHAKFDNKFTNMLHSKDIQTMVEWLKQSSNENAVDIICRMRSKNGYIWVSNSISLVTVGKKQFYQGTLTDITDFVAKRKNQDESLKEQVMVFDTLARHFKNVYWVDLKRKTAKILKLEAAYVDVLGKKVHQEFSFETVVGNWINTIVYSEDRDKVSRVITIENIKKVFETQEELVGNYRSFVNGKIHYFQYSIGKVDKDGTKAIAGFQNIDDIIEEHQKIEKAKREKEIAHQKEVDEQLAIINSLSKSFRNVFVANLKEGTARAIRLADNYKVRAIRDIDTRTFQFDAVVDRWVRETVHPDDKKRIKETLNVKNIRQIFSKQDKYVGTYRNIEDGVQHYYQYDFRRIDDTENVVVGFRLIDKIVEEQKENQKRERALEQARLKEEKEHAEVIDSLSTIYSTIFRADILTHEYEILTSVPLMKTVAATKGIFDDVKDTIIESFMEPEFKEPLREFLDLNTLASRLENVNTITTDYKAPTGQWMQARFIVKRRNENGMAIETLYVARDITEEKTRDFKQREALTEALAAAQQANKAKTIFLNNMSHDIRTPMNAIIGFTTLAQTHLEDFSKVEDYLNKISTSSNHLLSLINNILDMSRIESGAVKLDEEAVHIPDLLHTLRTMIQSLADSKKINLHIDMQDLVHEDVLTDKLRLNQVLLNIVGNAINFTRPGGNIVIRVSEKPCNLKPYTTYEFSIKDNGIGMSKEFVGHIFDMFSREYSSTVSGIQGTGLGMAITKNIVDMMGGDIRVESEEGKGTLFTVVLNLCITNEPDKIEEKRRSYNYRGKRVLLVEDNELNREIATTILEETGMIIDSVEDGDIAVMTIKEEPAEKYDLILMDVQMPRMDGYTATREIRALADNKKSNIPIVAVTANAFEEDRKKAIESGMNGHIIKPISIEQIAKVLDEIFEIEKV